MTNKEILKFAIRGIEDKIQIECERIGDSCVNDGKLKCLKDLISQYDEIKEMIEKEEETK